MSDREIQGLEIMTDPQTTDLNTLAAQASQRPVPEPVSAIADAIRSGAPDLSGTQGGVIAMLAYGSCLRDASVEESLVDLYVLVDRYAGFHPGKAMQLANRLIPPNVYYAECQHEGRLVRSKYAVVSLDQFEQRVMPDTRNPYFWARFAQPTAIVYAKDAQIRNRVETALATAILTTLQHGISLTGEAASPRDVWTAVFQRTYGTELRSENADRARQIVDANLDFYQTAFAVGLDVADRPSDFASHWRWRRIEGKLLSVARLVKAAFTFQGGADYLAWKIARHSGVTVELTPWQRRHPILAAFVLLPQLYLRGGFR